MIVEIFEKQVNTFADKPAVITDTTQLTYKELNNHANRVAGAIQEYENETGVNPEKPVTGLLFEHGVDMIVGLMGTLKAANIYVPLDVNYPVNRLAYMLEHSEAYLVLTNTVNLTLAEELAGKVKQKLKIININNQDNHCHLEISRQDFPHDRLAYILYTSGSTGKPKGVVQDIKNVWYYIRNWTQRFSITASDRMTLFSAFSHDGAGQDIFGALLNGATLYPYNILNRPNIAQLTQWLTREKITIWHSVPTLYRYFIHTLQNREPEEVHFPDLRFVLLGGEQIRSHDIDMFKKYFPHSIFANVYGQTESSVSTIWLVHPRDSIRHLLIGEPLDNTKLFITRENGEILEDMGVGEIYVSSPHLALGYWQDKKMSDEVFFHDPETGSLYRTGDLGRLMSDGSIELMGRKDAQLKIRGFRVEKGEIEGLLLKHESIKEAVVKVITDKNRENRLCAYFTANLSALTPGKESALTVSQLREYLSRQLPEYMIPSYFMELEKMPLTPNGKLDIKALPDPEPVRPRLGVNYTEPQTQIESKLTNTWKEVLNLDKVGIDDNFFDLGGTSFDILTVMSKLHEEFHKDIPVISIFRYPTIRAFSSYLLQGEQDGIIKGKRVGLQSGKQVRGQKDDIAVIGMAGRFPGSKNIHEFWENLRNGVESITFFTIGQLEASGIDPELLQNPDYVKACGYLEEVEYFDAAFFNYSPVEAELMDPQLRILHECSWLALEHAGYDAESYQGYIGIYTANSPNHYWVTLTYLNDRDYLDSIFLNNNYSTKISYKLNLHGPSVGVQTACSSSLTAIHMACQGLLDLECDMALAGGVSVELPTKTGYLYREEMILSPDGHCRVFDAQANGTIFGNGVGIVVLKRLDRALADGDTIHALIKTTAINNDGKRKVGLTAPSIDGQAEVIRTALLRADVEPESIGFVESHGTGTSLGDPVEVEALKLAFNSKKKHYCALGSVKSNIGHLNSAAGAAGFIKAVLALKHRCIPPTLNFNLPNPRIDFENSPFYVNTRLKDWKSSKYPLRAGVSSFGIGGTNAHVILEEAPPDRCRNAIDRVRDKEGHAVQSNKYQLILLSARTQTALEQMTGNLAQYLEQHPGIDLAEAAYTLQVGRKSFEYRRMLVCSEPAQAIDTLSGSNRENLQTALSKEEPGPLIFMFPGQGAQYVNMGKGLYETEPVFRETMDRCFEILKPLTGYDIKEILYPTHPAPSGHPSQEGSMGGSLCPPRDGAGSPGQGHHSSNRSNGAHTSYTSYQSHINQTEIAQPVLFIFEYALSKLLMEWGIKPAAMIGHSIGEYTAACLSGVFSLEHALDLVVSRGRLMQQMPPGAMLSVSLPHEQLVPLLGKNEYNGEVELAVVNSPSLCVVSGTHPAISAFEQELTRKGYETHRLHTSHAFHSRMMEPILSGFAREAGRITASPPTIPYISNLTGQRITPEQVSDPWYWAKHLRAPVRFSEGLKQLLNESSCQGTARTFIEVGPGNVLSSLVKQHIPASNNGSAITIGLVKHPKETVPDEAFLLEKIGRLWLYGTKPDWSGFYKGEKVQRIPLPGYPFERQRYWLEGNPLALTRNSQISRVRPPDKPKDIADWFYIPYWRQSFLPGIPGRLEPRRPGVFLVFTDEHGLGDQLAKVLKEDGYEVKLVERGSSFAQSGDNRWQVNPGRSRDYETLVQLFKPGELPDHILHLWSVTGNGNEDVVEFLDTGFYSVLYLIRAIEAINQGKKSKISLSVVGNYGHPVLGDEMIYPGKTAVLGLLKVIPREYPHICCRSIDVQLPDTVNKEDKKLIEKLLKEITADTADTLVAYRKNQRWIREFEPIQLPVPDQEVKVFREGGVYLVTGGLGGIGFILARHLAAEYSARLILTGRRVFPAKKEWGDWLKEHGEADRVSRKIRQLLTLEEVGAEVLVFSADVSDEAGMQQVIAAAQERFGPIHGVIHAAGVLNEDAFDPMETLSRQSCEEQFKAKIHGVQVLENLLEGKPLDFCLLMSSLSSIAGGLGHGAYAAANCFMDTFVYKHNRNSPGSFPWISVNWDRWNTEEPASTTLEKHQWKTSIKPEQGKEALERILAWNHLPQFVVSPGNLQTIINQPTRPEVCNPEEKEKEKAMGYTRPNISTPFAAPGSELEQMIAEVWQELLGIEQIGLNDNFFDLGATSMVMIQAHKKITEKHGKDIPLDAMFQYPTINALLEYLAGTEKPSEENTSDEKLTRAANRAKQASRRLREK